MAHMAAMTAAPLPGVLFCFNAGDARLVAFESGCHTSRKKVIMLGGLTDGLMACPYVTDLSKAAEAAGWSCVQPLLSSCYLGYGTGSLSRDTEEINCLLQTLVNGGADSFALVGHSTGCQQSVHFTKHGSPELVSKVKFVTLQAPVSDREYAATQPGVDDNIRLARSTPEKAALMPRSADPAPITVERFLSLYDVGGADDMFSSDLSDSQLQEQLGHLGSSPHCQTRCANLSAAASGRKVLVAFSMADEYVPPSVPKDALLARLVSAIQTLSTDEPQVQGLALPDANHNLTLPEDGTAARLFIQAVIQGLV